MTFLSADPTAAYTPVQLARRIAKSLEPHHLALLRAIVEGTEKHSERRGQRLSALLRRGLVAFGQMEEPYMLTDGVERNRLVIKDLQATSAGRAVILEADILNAPNAYTGRALGEHQEQALQNLAEHNTGSWWRGCGWTLTTPSATARMLDSLVLAGLAARVCDEPGDEQYMITDMGREEAKPHALKANEARARRAKERGEEVPAVENELITLEQAMETVSQRKPNARFFEDVRLENGTLCGWTWTTGNFTTTAFGGITVRGHFPNTTEVYRSYAEDMIRGAYKLGE